MQQKTLYSKKLMQKKIMLQDFDIWSIILAKIDDFINMNGGERRNEALFFCSRILRAKQR